MGESSWPQVSAIRALRALRVIRLLRALRVLRFFSQLRVMIRSIMHSVKPLIWATLVLVFMWFLFGMMMTQGTIDFLQEEGSWDHASTRELRDRFGTPSKSALSLFQAMAGGVDWGELYNVLDPLGFHFQFILLFFVLFAVFGAANVMTGIFVEIAKQWAHNDRDMQVQEELNKRVFYLRAMEELFSELDPDNTGILTLKDFQDLLMNDKRILHTFHALQLELMDVRTLFLLLDRDRKGFINVEEFLLGVLRLRGDAKQMDVMKLQYQTEWIMHNLGSVGETLELLRDKLGINFPSQPARSVPMAPGFDFVVRKHTANSSLSCEPASSYIRQTGNAMAERSWEAALSRESLGSWERRSPVVTPVVTVRPPSDNSAAVDRDRSI